MRAMIDKDVRWFEVSVSNTFTLEISKRTESLIKVEFYEDARKEFNWWRIFRWFKSMVEFNDVYKS